MRDILETDKDYGPHFENKTYLNHLFTQKNSSNKYAYSTIVANVKAMRYLFYSRYHKLSYTVNNHCQFIGSRIPQIELADFFN